MKGHSKAMGDELDRQKHVIDKMDNKMDRANLKTTKVNGILTKIMKK